MNAALKGKKIRKASREEQDEEEEHLAVEDDAEPFNSDDNF